MAVVAEQGRRSVGLSFDTTFTTIDRAPYPRNRFVNAQNMGNGLKTLTNFQSFEIMIFEVISNYRLFAAFTNQRVATSHK